MFNLIGIIHKSTFKLFILKGKSPYEEITIELPESVVSKGDIFDLDKFSYELKNELVKRPELKGHEILFLIPEEKVFSKTANANSNTEEEELKKFYSEIPLSEEEALVTTLPLDGKVQFIAVPKILISNIETSLSKVGFICSFLPLNQLTAFGFGTKKRQAVGFRLDEHFNLVVVEKDQVIFAKEIDLEKDKIEKVVKEFEKLREESGMNDLEGVILLNEDEGMKSYFEENGIKVGLVQVTNSLYETFFKIIANNRSNIERSILGPKKTKRKIYFPIRKILTMVGIILFLFLLVGLFLFFKDLGSKMGTSEVAVSPTPTLTPTPTLVASPSATITATPSASVVQKSDLKVKILNANGIPGDAGRVQKKLQALGYTNSETDTADKQGQRITDLKVSSKVTTQYQAELKKALEADYVQVNVSTTAASGVDVEIATGAKK